jgi:hypothetical protein
MVAAGFTLLKDDFLYEQGRYGSSFGAPNAPGAWIAHIDIWKQYADGDKMFLPTKKWRDGKVYTKMVFPRIKEIIRVPFLGELFPIPSNYDEILTVPYGDWKKPDPHYVYVDSTNFE